MSNACLTAPPPPPLYATVHPSIIIAHKRKEDRTKSDSCIVIWEEVGTAPEPGRNKAAAQCPNVYFSQNADFFKMDYCPFINFHINVMCCRKKYNSYISSKWLYFFNERLDIMRCRDGTASSGTASSWHASAARERRRDRERTRLKRERQQALF